MSTKEGQRQEDAEKSREPAEPSMTELLHNFDRHNKKKEPSSLRMKTSPVMIASLFLSVVLFAAVCKMGVEAFSLRKKVEEVAQENTQLAKTLESMEEELQHSKDETKNEQSMPAKSASEKPRPVKKRTSAKPSKISKIIYRVKDGDSLPRLSKSFGVSVEQLRSWNGIERTDPLLAGQVLIINKTMTTDDLPYVAQDGGRDKVDEIENEGSGTTAGRGEAAEIGARGKPDYISKQEALEQIAQVRAAADTANKTIAQLQAKLATDYMSKQEALEQIAQVRAAADTANKTIAQLQAKLDSDRKMTERTIATLETETQKRESLEKKLATDEAVGKSDAMKAKALVRKPNWAEETDEHTGTSGEETITDKTATETIHVIRAGENLFSLGVKYGISWVALAKHNNLASPNSIYVGQKLRIPAIPTTKEEPVMMGGITHTVQTGENLRRIGRIHGVSWRRIATENGIIKPDNIYVGQVLNIPVEGPGKNNE